MKTKNYRLSYFLWSGINPSGKQVREKIYARNKQEAIELLIQKQIEIRQIKKISPPLFIPRKQRATDKAITLITRQLATMLNASLPLTTSLSLIAHNQKKAECRTIILSAQREIEAGASLSNALENASHLFDELYINLVTMAEQSGQLAYTFERIANYREKTNNKNLSTSRR